MIANLAEWLGWKIWAARGPMLRWGSSLLSWAAERRQRGRPPPEPLTYKEMLCRIWGRNEEGEPDFAGAREKLSRQIYDSRYAENPFRLPPTKAEAEQNEDAMIEPAALIAIAGAVGFAFGFILARVMAKAEIDQITKDLPSKDDLIRLQRAVADLERIAP